MTQNIPEMIDKSLVQRRNYKKLVSLDENYLNAVNRNQSHKYVRSVSIKINHHKLPPDFFSRTESLRKNRVSNSERKKLLGDVLRKAQSEQDDYSPQKTSFFGFIQQYSPKKNTTIANSSKRKFDSRQQPKRDRVFKELRHLTPANRIQRSEFLNLYPQKPDLELTETILSPTKTKGLQLSPRKQYLYKNKELQEESKLIDPKKLLQMSCNQQPLTQNISIKQDGHNMTFFNAKSTSFPPINKNKNLN